MSQLQQQSPGRYVMKDLYLFNCKREILAAKTRNPADHNPSKADQARDRIKKSFEPQPRPKALHL